MLDKKAENSPLDQDELNLKHVMNERLADLLRRRIKMVPKSES
jgi:hypothetical protein